MARGYSIVHLSTTRLQSSRVARAPLGFPTMAIAVYHLTQTVLALQKERIPSAPSSRP